MSDAAVVQGLRQQLESVIVGQTALLDRLIVALVAGGHVLLEGPPGLAKTTAVHVLASSVSASFQRIQFTPDLMPGDLTGSDIYEPADGGHRTLAEWAAASARPELARVFATALDAACFAGDAPHDASTLRQIALPLARRRPTLRRRPTSATSRRS